MMISRRTFLIGTTAGVAAAASPVAAKTMVDALVMGDDGLYVQPWFMQTFLDLREDLEEARAAGKRFVVLWEQKGCPYCKEMHEINLRIPKVRDYVRGNFGVLQLNLWGAREVTDFDGETLEERKLARKWRVNYTPTMQFFPESLEKIGEQSGLSVEVARMPGYFRPFHFISIFEFVKERIYERTDFQRYLQEKFARIEAEGKKPEVW